MTQVTLDNTLRNAVEGGTPVEIVDQITNRVYYLITAEQFHGLPASSQDCDPREFYPTIDKAMAADDAHDPFLESYQ